MSSSHASSRATQGLALTPFRIARALLLDHRYFWYTATLVFIGEAILNFFIIEYVSYTEIDWMAYMQEVGGFLNGERDYMNLKGDTGPLVYPAGFVYIYSLLYNLTNRGTNIRLGQYFFSVLYLFNLLIVMQLYRKSTKIPPYLLVLLCLSKRVHSIYVLRLFNDPVAMFFMYLCLLALTGRRWTLGCIFYSAALSVKMNILLFLPAFGLILWKAVGAWRTFLSFALINTIQVLLAWPFLLANPDSYIARAFEFSRIFIYKWTVNWKFLSPETFVSPGFAQVLILLHVLVIVWFLFTRWCRADGGVFLTLWRGLTAPKRVVANSSLNLSPDHIITLMFTSNFIGIVFSRTLHYQFYVWYFHGLPYLLWHCRIPVVARLIIFFCIEYCWNVFPSTSTSSLILLVSHLAMLITLWMGDAEGRGMRRQKYS
ncbi:uncharacterized protein VTP21DRAFT_4722 [Calcarisporiella thermophila]|uniref:uncharacterized protein n=1 Tax=Calcarisporiella thermophila TaxID=911321 RepID=UPI0037443DB2